MSDETKAVEKYTYQTDHGEVALTPDTVIKYLTSTNKHPVNQVDIMLFISTCRYQNLNPFLKEAYLLKYSKDKPASIVVGRGVHEKRAAKNPQYDGIESGIIVKTENGPEYRDGAFTVDGEVILGGWATGYRKDQRVPKKVAVKYEDYVGHEYSTWGKLPALMIEKVAIVQCLRSMFPEDLAGLYSVDESRAMEETQTTVAATVRDGLIMSMDQGRIEIEKLIELHQHALVDEAIESVRIDIEASKSLNDIREVYDEFKGMCDTLGREESRIETAEVAQKAAEAFSMKKASEILPATEAIANAAKLSEKSNADDEGASAAFDAEPEQRGDLF